MPIGCQEFIAIPLSWLEISTHCPILDDPSSLFSLNWPHFDLISNPLWRINTMEMIYKYNGKGNGTHGGPPRFMGFEKMRTRWEWTWWAMKIEYSPTKNHFDDPSSIFLVMPQIRMYTFPPKLRQLHCRKLGKLGKRGKFARTIYRNWKNSGFGQKRFYSLNTTFGSFVSLFYVQQELCSRKFRRSWYQNKNRWTKCSESEHIKLYSNILNLIKPIIRSKHFACRFLIRETLGKPNGLFSTDQDFRLAAGCGPSGWWTFVWMYHLKRIFGIENVFLEISVCKSRSKGTFCSILWFLRFKIGFSIYIIW